MSEHQGQLLRVLIAKAGLTLSAFAARAGVSRARLQAWVMQPHLGIRLDKRVAIAAALDLSLEEFDAAVATQSAAA